MKITDVINTVSSADTVLAELRLTREGLCTAVEAAIEAGSTITANHPNNSYGTYKYHEGTAALRDQFVGENGWVRDSNNNIESIYNPDLGIKVVFQNVDLACNPAHIPQASTPKKAGTQRCIETNSLFQSSEIPHLYNPTEKIGTKTYYLMVSANFEEVESELTLVTELTPNGQFKNVAQRVFLSYADWYASADREYEKEEEAADDITVEISRK